MNRRFKKQYQACVIERPPAIQGEAATVIATDVKMLIDPLLSYDNPQEANQRPQLSRFRGSVLDKSHAGVANIKKFDIIQTSSGREFLILEKLDAVGTDVLEFELEAR